MLPHSKERSKWKRIERWKLSSFSEMMTSKQGGNAGFGELPVVLACLAAAWWLCSLHCRPGSSLRGSQNDIPLLILCQLSFKLLSTLFYTYIIISNNVFSLVPVSESYIWPSIYPVLIPRYLRLRSPKTACHFQPRMSPGILSSLSSVLWSQTRDCSLSYHYSPVQFITGFSGVLNNTSCVSFHVDLPCSVQNPGVSCG